MVSTSGIQHKIYPPILKNRLRIDNALSRPSSLIRISRSSRSMELRKVHKVGIQKIGESFQSPERELHTAQVLQLQSQPRKLGPYTRPKARNPLIHFVAGVGVEFDLAKMEGGGRCAGEGERNWFGVVEVDCRRTRETSSERELLRRCRQTS